MTGADVEDWQNFLAGRGLYDGVIDGVFGPITSRATREYQRGAGLGDDGVVGPRTYLQAVHDGMQSATRTLSAGMDASTNCTDFVSCIREAGMRFVVRYYSRFVRKTLTATEARAIGDAGLNVAVVYQDAQDNLDSFTPALATRNADKALELASTIGQPAGSAIYFAVDFNPASEEIRGPIAEYFQTVNQAFRDSGFAIGVYGSGLICRLIRDASLAQFAWLSGSTGFRESAAFRPRAHLIQVLPSRNICNGRLNIDDDIAQTEDFGAFQV
jgi:hypothetical protein